MLTRLAIRQTKKDFAILIATPTHGNLGDHAIVCAEQLFLNDIGITNFEVERFQYERFRKAICAMCQTSLVVIDGGGNVGTLWPEESDKMNDVIVRFSRNPVAVFPQTAYFGDSAEGNDRKKRTAEAYAKNPNLLFFSRDRATYDIVRKIAPKTRNLYVPDIVLYLDESGRGLARSGALLCLRSDKERAVDVAASTILRNALETRNLFPRETDTVIALSEFDRIDASNRAGILDAKWNEFSSAEVVVTDRLHGMFFSAITGTPCVALDNVSRKVSQGYAWIKHIPNIRIAQDIGEVPELIDEVIAEGPCRYDRSPLDPYYEKMKAAILGALK